MKIDINKNNVVCGDCLDWLQDIPPKSIDMCYIDPPFFSNKQHEIIWGNGYELRSFDDRWKGGVSAYIEWMEERVRLIHRCLKDTGSIFLHCDWRANHRIRIMLDDVFGENNYLNEIIWHYDGMQSPSKVKLARKHDNILRYAKRASKAYANKEKLYYYRKIDSLELKNYRKDEKGYYYDFAQNDYTVESVKKTRKGRARPLHPIWET